MGGLAKRTEAYLSEAGCLSVTYRHACAYAAICYLSTRPVVTFGYYYSRIQTELLTGRPATAYIVGHADCG